MPHASLDNQDTLVNAFTFTRNYDAWQFET